MTVFNFLQAGELAALCVAFISQDSDTYCAVAVYAMSVVTIRSSVCHTLKMA